MHAGAAVCMTNGVDTVEAIVVIGVCYLVGAIGVAIAIERSDIMVV